MSDAVVAHLIDINGARTAVRAETLRRKADAAGDDGRDAAEAAFAVEEMKYLLARAINLLPEREKIVMTLLYFKGMSAEDLATVLGTSVARVKQLQATAMLALRDSLAAAGIDLELALRNRSGG